MSKRLIRKTFMYGVAKNPERSLLILINKAC